VDTLIPRLATGPSLLGHDESKQQAVPPPQAAVRLVRFRHPVASIFTLSPMCKPPG